MTKHPLINKWLRYLPGTRAWRKHQKLRRLRTLLLAQGQDVSRLNDDQLEIAALEVRRQVITRSSIEKEADKG